jgi:hypothetical protein
MPRSTNLSVAAMGIDIGKNSFHVVGWISVVQSSCASDGRAARSEPGWRTCHLV